MRKRLFRQSSFVLKFLTNYFNLDVDFEVPYPTYLCKRTKLFSVQMEKGIAEEVSMLKIQIEREGNVAVFHLDGRIVRGNELSTLRSEVSLQPYADTIILDLAMVEVIDAGGLGALLDLREWARVSGVEFKLENPNRQVAEVFRITCLDSVFAMSPEIQRNFCNALAA